MDWKSTRSALFILTITGIAVRAILFFIYSPVIWPDTVSYTDVAHQILNMDFTQYIGARTPVYPLFLILCGMNFFVVWILQSLLGVATSLMLFVIAWRQTRDKNFSLLVGLVSTLSLNLLFFEANIATESLSVFLMVLALLLLQTVQQTGPALRRLLVLGAIVALAGLTKPLLLLTAPIFFLAIWHVSRRKGMLSALAAFSLLPIILVGGWCIFNGLTVGTYGPTTLTGFNLTNHSGGFIEMAPDRYATIRDIYIKYRQEHYRQGKDHSQTIWDAEPEIRQATGLSYLALSRELATMSTDLIIHHPGLYLKSVARGWLDFWKISNAWKPEQIHPEIVRKTLIGFWWVERRLIMGLELVFFAGIIWQGIRWLRRKTTGWDLAGIAAVIVLLGSVLQAMVERGDGARYAIPFQPLLVFVSLMWIREFLPRFYKRG